MRSTSGGESCRESPRISDVIYVMSAIYLFVLSFSLFKQDVAASFLAMTLQWETSLCPLYDHRFYSSSVTNVMHSDYEEDLFHLHSVRENEIIENVFYLPADIEYATFSNTVQDGDILDARFMEDMLLMDSDVEGNTHSSSSQELEPVTDLQLVDEESREILVNVGEVSQRSGIEEEMVKELSVADLLLMGADAVQTEKWQLASTVISRLTHLLCDQENEKNRFNRVAFFFTEALRFKSFGGYPTHRPIPGTPAPTTRMSTFQMLQELTPYVKFAHFTANQAILEAAEGATHLHIIDFEVMEGIQWPPLMVDLALKKDISLRITAIAQDHYVAGLVQQTGRRLKEFANSIDNNQFTFDQIVIENEDDFTRIEVAGSTVIVNCMIHQLHLPKRSFTAVKSFLSGATKLSPKMVVLVEEELFDFLKIPWMTFTEFFSDALQHYSALLDSLTCTFSVKYEAGLELIEKEYLVHRITDSLEQFPCGKKEREFWVDELSSLMKGFRTIRMSSSNVSQAKFLAGLFHGSYWVQHEKCRLSLYWKSRPLTTASVWLPT